MSFAPIALSSLRWWANQRRIQQAALAHTLLEAMPRLSLKGTALTRSNVQTILLKLIRVGALIIRKKSVIRIHLSSQHPLKDLFARVAAALLVTPGVVLPRDRGLKLRVPHRKLLLLLLRHHET